MHSYILCVVTVLETKNTEVWILGDLLLSKSKTGCILECIKSVENSDFLGSKMISLKCQHATAQNHLKNDREQVDLKACWCV